MGFSMPTSDGSEAAPGAVAGLATACGAAAGWPLVRCVPSAVSGLSMPATAASIEPRMNVVAITRSVGIPINDEVSKLYDTARIARPYFVP